MKYCIKVHSQKSFIFLKEVSPYYLIWYILDYLIASLCGKKGGHSYAHFTGEKTMAQKNMLTYPGSHSLLVIPGIRTQTPVFLFNTLSLLWADLLCLLQLSPAPVSVPTSGSSHCCHPLCPGCPPVPPVPRSLPLGLQ